MSGPFDGLLVVEFGQFVVVPFCAQMLADAGARVIKVEPPTGDSYRSVNQIAPMESRQFIIKNRGKESIAIQLGHPDSAPVVRALLERADVVLVNLSPAATRRRGLDYDSVAAVNPQVVYGAATAFGTTGAEADLPGMDVVVQARSGIMSSLGAEHDGLPHHSEVQVADYASALVLFAAISTALYHRERTGQGQRVDVSLLGAALAVQNNALAHVYGHDDQWRAHFINEVLPQMRARGASHDEVEARRTALRPDPAGHTHHYRVFRTADGAVAVGAGSPPSRHRLGLAAGLDPQLGDSDPAAFGAALATTLETRETQYWLTALREVDVPVAAVAHVEEMVFDPHLEAEGLVADYHHPVVGRYRAFGVPFGMSRTPLDGQGRGSPVFASSTDEVLAELGFDTDARDELVRTGAVVRSGPPPPEDHRPSPTAGTTDRCTPTTGHTSTRST